MISSNVREYVNDDIFASFSLSKALPTYEFPTNEQNPDQVYQAVKDELMLDGNSRQNLATFCQTWLDDKTHQIMDKCIDKNMIDKDEYPQTAEVEMRCVNMLSDLWNSPEAETTLGCSTTGSSEACMLGGLALKWKWREKMKDEGKSTDRPNLVTGPVQICWHKFCKYWDIELREIPMSENRYIMTAEEMLKYVDENTIGVIPTLGVTFTGQYENVAEISKALDGYQKETGIDIPIHVDAASGGFLAPFCQPKLNWDFKIPRVKSINASGHKFGLSPLGVGWVVWRTKEDLPEDLIFMVNYLGGNMPTFALNFSRPAGQIIAQYYNFIRLGREGYTRVQQACYDVAKYLSEEINKLNVFDVISDGTNAIPALTWKLNKEADIGATLYDVADRLRTYGWLSPAYSLPKDATDVVVMRVLVKHGFSMDLAKLYINDLKKALEHFKHNPITVPLNQPMFNHSGRSININ